MNCELHTDDKAVEEKNEDTGSLTYWASEILNTACPQQKVSEEHCIISTGLVRGFGRGWGWTPLKNSNLLNSQNEITKNRLWTPHPSRKTQLSMGPPWKIFLNPHIGLSFNQENPNCAYLYL